METVRVLCDAHPGAAMFRIFKADAIDRSRAVEGADRLPGLAVLADLDSAPAGAPLVSARSVLDHDPGELGVLFEAHRDVGGPVVGVACATVLTEDTPVVLR